MMMRLLRKQTDSSSGILGSEEKAATKNSAWHEGKILSCLASLLHSSGGAALASVHRDDFAALPLLLSCWSLHPYQLPLMRLENL